MRTPVLIGIAAVAGFALAWLLLRQVPHAPAPAAKPSVVAAAPAPVAVEAPRKEPEPPPPPPPQPQPKESKPPPPSPHPAVEPPPEPESNSTAEEEEPEDDGKPGIDTDHAADLFADLITHEEAKAEDENGLPDPVAQTWKKFDKEETDSNWSGPTTQQIEAALEQWINSLPAEIQDHIAVIHVECRTTLCQILAADNDADTQSDRSQAGQEWQQAIATLPAQPWYNELGFVNFVTQVTSKDGYILYMTYMMREVKPVTE